MRTLQQEDYNRALEEDVVHVSRKWSIKKVEQALLDGDKTTEEVVDYVQKYVPDGKVFDYTDFHGTFEWLQLHNVITKPGDGKYGHVTNHPCTTEAIPAKKKKKKKGSIKKIQKKKGSKSKSSNSVITLLLTSDDKVLDCSGRFCKRFFDKCGSIELLEDGSLTTKKSSSSKSKADRRSKTTPTTSTTKSFQDDVELYYITMSKKEIDIDCDYAFLLKTIVGDTKSTSTSTTKKSQNI